MLDDLLNSIAFTVVVAIAAAAAANFQPPVLADQAGQAARVAEATAPVVVKSPATVVQLPTVVVVGRRERAAELLSAASAD